MFEAQHGIFFFAEATEAVSPRTGVVRVRLRRRVEKLRAPGHFIRRGPPADAALKRWLPPESEAPTRLHQAMRYAVFAGGKLADHLGLRWRFDAFTLAHPPTPISSGL